MSHLSDLGKRGEAIAVEYLQDKGYHIIDANFRTRAGEIDIIAQEKEKYVFFEVKTRKGDLKGKPYEAVTFRKIKHLQAAIKYYIVQNRLVDKPLRIDVISIELKSDGSIARLRHFENALFV